MNSTDYDRPITVLVADSHEITRGTTASLIRGLGLNVLQAVDSISAIKVVQDHPLDLVIFDNVMDGVSSFDLPRYIQSTKMNLPLIMIAEEQSTDQLQYASSLGIRHILRKPVDPNRLEAFLLQILSHTKKLNLRPKATLLTDRTAMTPQQTMAHTIDLARKNALGGFGGPFASVIADSNGYIIGEGVNLPTSRFDPIAHAEVMAIRKAIDYLQQPHLEGCVIYSTVEPTSLAVALIESVGISRIVYGLRHDEIKSETPQNSRKPIVKTMRLGEDAVRTMLKDVGYV